MSSYVSESLAAEYPALSEAPGFVVVPALHASLPATAHWEQPSRSSGEAGAIAHIVVVWSAEALLSFVREKKLPAELASVQEGVRALTEGRAQGAGASGGTSRVTLAIVNDAVGSAVHRAVSRIQLEHGVSVRQLSRSSLVDVFETYALALEPSRVAVRDETFLCGLDPRSVRYNEGAQKTLSKAWLAALRQVVAEKPAKAVHQSYPTFARLYELCKDEAAANATLAELPLGRRRRSGTEVGMRFGPAKSQKLIEVMRCYEAAPPQCSGRDGSQCVATRQEEAAWPRANNEARAREPRAAEARAREARVEADGPRVEAPGVRRSASVGPVDTCSQPGQLRSAVHGEEAGGGSATEVDSDDHEAVHVSFPHWDVPMAGGSQSQAGGGSPRARDARATSTTTTATTHGSSAARSNRAASSASAPTQFVSSVRPEDWPSDVSEPEEENACESDDSGQSLFEIACSQLQVDRPVRSGGRAGCGGRDAGGAPPATHSSGRGARARDGAEPPVTPGVSAAGDQVAAGRRSHQRSRSVGWPARPLHASLEPAEVSGGMDASLDASGGVDASHGALGTSTGAAAPLAKFGAVVGRQGRSVGCAAASDPWAALAGGIPAVAGSVSSAAPGRVPPGRPDPMVVDLSLDTSDEDEAVRGAGVGRAEYAGATGATRDVSGYVPGDLSGDVYRDIVGGEADEPMEQNGADVHGDGLEEDGCSEARRGLSPHGSYAGGGGWGDEHTGMSQQMGDMGWDAEGHGSLGGWVVGLAQAAEAVAATPMVGGTPVQQAHHPRVGAETQRRRETNPVYPSRFF